MVPQASTSVGICTGANGADINCGTTISSVPVKKIIKTSNQSMIQPSACIIDGLELLTFQNEDDLLYYTIWEEAFRAQKTIQQLQQESATKNNKSTTKQANRISSASTTPNNAKIKSLTRYTTLERVVNDGGRPTTATAANTSLLAPSTSRQRDNKMLSKSLLATNSATNRQQQTAQSSAALLDSSQLLTHSEAETKNWKTYGGRRSNVSLDHNNSSQMPPTTPINNKNKRLIGPDHANNGPFPLQSTPTGWRQQERQQQQLPNQLQYDNGQECITETIWPNSKKLPPQSIRARFLRYRDDNKRNVDHLYKKKLSDYICSSLNRLTLITTEQSSFALRAIRTRNTTVNSNSNTTSCSINANSHTSSPSPSNAKMNGSGAAGNSQEQHQYQQHQSSTIRIILVPNSMNHISANNNNSNHQNNIKLAATTSTTATITTTTTTTNATTTTTMDSPITSTSNSTPVPPVSTSTPVSRGARTSIATPSNSNSSANAITQGKDAIPPLRFGEEFLVLNEVGVHHSLLTPSKNSNQKPLARIEPNIFKRPKAVPSLYTSFEPASLDEEVLNKKRKYYQNVKAIASRPKSSTPGLSHPKGSAKSSATKRPQFVVSSNNGEVITGGLNPELGPSPAKKEKTVFESPLITKTPQPSSSTKISPTNINYISSTNGTSASNKTLHSNLNISIKLKRPAGAVGASNLSNGLNSTLKVKHESSSNHLEIVPTNNNVVAKNGSSIGAKNIKVSPIKNGNSSTTKLASTIKHISKKSKDSKQKNCDKKHEKSDPRQSNKVRRISNTKNDDENEGDDDDEIEMLERDIRELLSAKSKS